MTRIEVLSYADTWRGSPYFWGGEKRSGVDCNGLARRVLTRFGLWPFPVAQDANAHNTMLRFVELGAEIAEDKLRPGDIFYALNEGGRAFHTGIIWHQTDLAIEAAGGDDTTDTLQEAIERNAFVRIYEHGRFARRRFVNPFFKTVE